jgi:hypothetical protein
MKLLRWDLYRLWDVEPFPPRWQGDEWALFTEWDHEGEPRAARWEAGTFEAMSIMLNSYFRGDRVPPA